MNSVFLKKYYFNVSREINSRFCSKTQGQIFLLVSCRHVDGVHLDGHQHGVSIQMALSYLRNIAVTRIMARVFAYLPSFISQILDLIY